MLFRELSEAVQGSVNKSTHPLFKAETELVRGVYRARCGDFPGLVGTGNTEEMAVRHLALWVLKKAGCLGRE
jgi:hypothetical protein